MKTEQDLQQRLAQLPGSIEPQRDLWPELAAKLAQTPQQPKWVEPAQKTKLPSGWWLAAAAVAMFGLWGPWYSNVESPMLVQQQPAAVERESLPETVEFPQTDRVYQHRAGVAKVQVSSETQWRMRSEYEQQRALKLAQITQVPDSFQDWKQQLQIWKQATHLVLLALQYQPDEPGLLRQLSKLQQQELAYLQKVVQADQT